MNTNKMIKTGKFFVFIALALLFSHVPQVSADRMKFSPTYGFLEAEPGEFPGMDLSFTGDFNNDGQPDFLIGAPYGSNGGAAYVIYGNSTTTLTPSFNLTNIDGTNGHKFLGEPLTSTGDKVSYAGDVNGDGIPDFIVNSQGYDDGNPMSNVGAVYCVYGGNIFSYPFNLTNLNGTNGFAVVGTITLNSGFGNRLSPAGDFNGDGYDDFLFSASNEDILGRSSAGMTFMQFGGPSLPAKSYPLADYNGSNGVVFAGETADDRLGSGLAGVGDINNDGFDDILISAPDKIYGGGTDHNGVVYLIYGRSAPFPSGIFDMTNFNSTMGVIFHGIGDYYGFGFTSMSPAGDVNGDTIPDFLIGAFNTHINGYVGVGATYLVFGSASFPSVVNISTIDGTNGAVFVGSMPSESSGWLTSKMGDFNNDGYDDFLISTLNALISGTINNAGRVSIIYGAASYTSPITLSTLDSSEGINIEGVANGDQFGHAIADAGDFNNDGLFDFVASTGGGNVNTYLFLGNNQTDTYRNITTGAIEPCPHGTTPFAIWTEDTTACACPLGSYMSLGSCAPCLAGFFLATPGDIFCTWCGTLGATHYTDTPGQTSCQTCPSGWDLSPSRSNCTDPNAGSGDGDDGNGDSGGNTDSTDTTGTDLLAIILPILAVVLVAGGIYYRKTHIGLKQNKEEEDEEERAISETPGKNSQATPGNSQAVIDI